MLILASGSPRRRELLEQIGAAYEVKVGTYAEDVPKTMIPRSLLLDRPPERRHPLPKVYRAVGTGCRYGSGIRR